MTSPAPIALQQAATPNWLLTQWQGAGWSVVRSAVLTPVPVGSSSGKVLTPHPLQLDAFQWTDVTLFGIGNADTAIQQLQQQIKQRGSSLFAYALFKQTNFDVLGVKVVSYRLLLLHSQVQLLVWAVAIIAAAFAATIFIQYLTTGQSPAVKDLQGLWAGVVQPVSDGIQQTTQGIAVVYLLGIAAAGAIAIAVGSSSKAAGVKAPSLKGPSGSIGVRGGGVSARIGS